ncbi:MAG: hypothetical protein M1822_000497 [Bathelium mastoideum]|nr:MAG: hypothetical protein M1822_000497 [Bathelium mastoideum]
MELLTRRGGGQQKRKTPKLHRPWRARPLVAPRSGGRRMQSGGCAVGRVQRAEGSGQWASSVAGVAGPDRRVEEWEVHAWCEEQAPGPTTTPHHLGAGELAGSWAREEKADWQDWEGVCGVLASLETDQHRVQQVRNKPVMASFSEYQNSIAVSEGNNDFVLYSTHDSYPDYMSTSLPYTSNPYVSSTGAGFEPFSVPSFPTTTAQSHDFGFGATSAPQNVKGHYPHTPAESPTNSANNSFDNQPPHLSSTSDSGASVQSTSSSAMGSPSLNPAFAHESWNTLGQGLGIAPGIVHHDQFGTSGFDYDPVLHDKIPGCVGESSNLSSTQHAMQSTPSSSSPAFSSVQNHQFQSQSQYSLNSFRTGPRSLVPAATALDTSMAGHQSPRSASSLHTPTSANPLPHSGLRRANSSGLFAAPGTSGFKSPTTPASATRPRVFTSPKMDRRHQLSSIPESRDERKRSMSTPLSGSPQVFSSSIAGHGISPSHAPQSHFFSQSSGSFVEPLQSSYPSLIQPYPPSSFPMPYPEYSSVSPQIRFDPHPPSPAPSDTSLRSPQRQGSNRFKAQSPFLHHTSAYQPYPQQYPMTRRPSAASVQSRGSHGTHRSDSIEEEGKEKGLCPIPECGRVFKDLKAHMLTHQNERPEKCPIPTCEYHQKGFARKYDKNRHTLTHYKGTMVCGFCPGPGSAAEKSFNRADVFKRHLTSVHGVEQTPPNSRKKSPVVSKKSYNSSHNTAGTCSTCSVTFANAQEFYEHLDDCVLRVVQQVDPSEATNQRLLASVADDKNVKETIDRLLPSSAIDYNANTYDEAEDDEEDESEKEDATDDTYGARNRSGKGGIRSNKKGVTKSTGGGSSAGGPGAHRRRGPGLTFSKGGVAANVSAAWSGRKKRKHYPPSWGCAAENMRMKKRVLCVYDGSRRLLKDDLMLNGEFEVRVSLPETGGRHYVTDLDIQTMARAEAMHNATAEEKGPWVADNVPGVDLEQLMA